MRDPRKKKPASKAKSGSGKKSSKAQEEQMMETDAQPTNATVWRAGIDPIAEDEELEYDATAYDCLHSLRLDWPALSFDIIKDNLGGPRSTFPHSLCFVAGTQAASAKQNYVAFVKLANLGQGRHGKKAKKEGEESEEESEEDEEMSEGNEEDEFVEEKYECGPPRMHVRLVNNVGGINRIRSCPQQPGVVAVWCDNAQVRILDGTKLMAELEAEQEVPAKPRGRVDLKPLQSHSHAMEGFAVDWSPLKAGRLATGDCRKAIHVWEPQEGGRWAVSGAFSGHESSVEDLQWSHSEETVFASCSADGTIRIWDTRERSRAMLTVKAHETDVNVISWNKLVPYMLVSGADDGALRIWDLRNFSAEGASPVSQFKFHSSHVSSVEWSPYEGSMFASTSGDNQLAVWDLALERDAEEEAALAPQGNAEAPADLPAQLMFVHAGQSDMKEVHWHAQIPGMLVSTAADGFNAFKPSNL